MEIEIQKTELENKRLELEDKKRKLENKENQNVEERINITNINVYLNNNNAYQVESILNPKLKEKMNSMQNMVVKKYQNIEKANGIYVDYTKTKIDYLV